ncbi:unnamed protein product [Rhodiola kirilowii]
MRLSKTFKDFNARVCDLVNEASTLGEALSEEKVVRKILRSLPKRFAMKVTVIKEANNVKTMDWKELIGNLCTYELQHQIVPEPKVKSVGLKAETVVDDESTNGVSEEVALLTKNFNKLLKKINHKGAGQNSLNQSRNQDTRKWISSHERDSLTRRKMTTTDGPKEYSAGNTEDLATYKQSVLTP